MNNHWRILYETEGVLFCERAITVQVAQTLLSASLITRLNNEGDN